MSVRIPYHPSISPDGFAFRSQMSLSLHALAPSCIKHFSSQAIHGNLCLYCELVFTKHAASFIYRLNSFQLPYMGIYNAVDN